MSILNIFVTLLIAGIWSPSCGALSPSTEEIIRKLEELRNLPNLQHSSLTMVKIEEIGRLIERKCGQNGGPGAFDHVADNVFEFAGCMQPYFNMQSFNLDIAAAESRNEWKFFLNKYCPNLPFYQTCGRPLGDSMMRCLDPEERSNVSAALRIASSFLEISCKDQRDNVASFIASGGVECVISEQESFVSCANEAFDGDFDSPDTLVAAILDRESLSPLGVSINECKNIKKFQACVVELFAQSGKKESAIIVNSMFISLENSTFCQNDRVEVRNVSVEEITTSTNPEYPGLNRGNDFESFIRNKCEKNGGPTAYDSAMESVLLVNNCSVTLMPELKNMVPHVDFEVELLNISKKICRRAPIFKELEKYGLDSVKPCFEPEEKRTLDVMHNVSSSFINFICHDDAERLALFLATDGPKCFESKISDIRDCGYQHFGNYIQAVMFMRQFETPLPELDAKFCEDLDGFKNCSVYFLSECENQTPSKLWDSLLVSISDEIPCENLHESQTTLVTEISSSTITPELDRISKILSSTVSDIRIFTGSYDADDMNVTSQEVGEYMRDKCERIGGPTAYDAAEGIPAYVANLYNTIAYNISQLVLDVTVPVWTARYGHLDTVVAEYCTNVRDIKKNVTHVAESIKPCLDAEDQEKVDLIVNTTSLVLDHVCENKGYRIVELFNWNGVKCITDNQETIKNCFNWVDRNRNSSSVVSELLHQLTFIQCNDVVPLRSCYVQSLWRCTATAELIDSLIVRITGLTAFRSVEKYPGVCHSDVTST